MAVVLMAALVCVAAGVVVVGLVGGSLPLLVGGATVAASVVIVVARARRAERARVVLNRPPLRSRSDWERHLQATGAEERRIDLRNAPEVAIDNYDDLLAGEILSSLETLSVDQLRDVIARERNGRNRQGVMRRAQQLIDLTEGRTGSAPDTLRRTPGIERTRRGPDLSL